MMWRPLFLALMVFSLFDGFISNWQTGNPMALLYKDFFLIAVFIIFMISENFKLIVQQLGKYLAGLVLFFTLLFIFITIAQIFNPYSPGLVLGILGLKLYFLYWFAIPMAYAYADSVDKGLGLLKAIGIASILVNLFGLQQFIYGPGWVMSTFGPGFYNAFHEAAFDEISGLRPEKSFFRVIATFASTGQYANFLQANVMLSFALIFSSKTKKERYFWYAVQVLNFVGLLAAGSRGSILFTMGQIGLFILLARGRMRVFGMVMLVVIGFTIGLSFMGEGVRARFGTIKQVSLIKERTVDFTSTIFLSHLERFPMGKGPGYASTAARHLNPLTGSTKQTWVENYPTKLQVELGLPGVAVFYTLLVILLKRWLLDWIPCFTEKTWNIGLPLSVYGLSYLGVLSFFGILETTPGALLVCMVLGLVLRLVDLSSSQDEQAPLYPES